MRAIPYALSVHHFISTVGADAGFAAIIGLAVVVLLFFAHARETANLRERANQAEDALRRLEQYVDQLSRSRPAPAAAPAPASASAVTAAPGYAQPAAAPAAAAPPAAAARTAAAPVAGRTLDPVRPPVGAPAGIPGAPAGVGAPALSAATRLIPAGDDAAIAIRASRSQGSGGASASATAASTAAVMDPPPPPPSTAAGGANGDRIPPAPPPASAGQTMSGRERLPLRPPAGRPTAPASTPRGRRGQRAGGPRIGRGAIVLALALIVVVAVGALLVITNSGSNGTTTAANRSAHSTSTPTTRRRKARASTAVTPGSITVAVLNGTSTTNLAHDISSKLKAAGFKQGSIATATDQTQNTTIVGYLPNDKPYALAVAKSLKLGSASVQAVDPNNRTVACNGSSTSCSAQVVVTVGTDLASNA
jgi:LytR cell envelope-related transcriptional attenuator